MNAPQEEQADAQARSESQKPAPREPRQAPRPREIGGRQGPEPTRFGDWEKGGRCIDF